MPPKKTFDDWVADVDPKLRPLARELRRMFLEAAPDLRESIKWGNPCFEKKVRIFYIASQSDKYVTLALVKSLKGNRGTVGFDIVEVAPVYDTSEDYLAFGCQSRSAIPAHPGPRGEVRRGCHAIQEEHSTIGWPT